MLLASCSQQIAENDELECGRRPGPSGSRRNNHPLVYHRLSSSVGEVYQAQTHGDVEDDNLGSLDHPLCGESLESTRSLNYLEWVHERQTKRMRTRSEWFLSPVLPTKNSLSSKSADFEQRQLPSASKHQVGNVAMTSSSKDFDCVSKSESSGKTRTRQPLHSLQTRQQEIVPKSAHSTSVATEEDIGGVKKSVERAQTTQHPSKGVPGIVRRRSWRTHYVRPGKSFDYDERSTLPQESVEYGSTHSTPVRRRSTTQNASVPESRRISSGIVGGHANIESKHPQRPGTESSPGGSVLHDERRNLPAKSSSHNKFVHF